MNIAPLYGTPEQWFTEMAKLAAQGRQNGFPLDTLSMGMSGDMEIAIACGATIIRVGSLIYRPQNGVFEGPQANYMFIFNYFWSSHVSSDFSIRV